MVKRGAKASTHILRVTLKPRITRDIEIGSGRSLYDLAEAIVYSYGFSFDHAFGFYSRVGGQVLRSPVRYELFSDIGEAGEGARSVKKTSVAEAFPERGSKMTFLFDYGDTWLFRVQVRDRGTNPSGRARATVIDGIGEAPEQYPPEEGDWEEEEEEDDEP